MGICPQTLKHTLGVIQSVYGQQYPLSFVARNPIGIMVRCGFVLVQQSRVLLGSDANGKGFEMNRTPPDRDLCDLAFGSQHPEQSRTELLQVPMSLESNQISPEEAFQEFLPSWEDRKIRGEPPIPT